MNLTRRSFLATTAGLSVSTLSGCMNNLSTGTSRDPPGYANWLPDTGADVTLFTYLDFQTINEFNDFTDSFDIIGTNDSFHKFLGTAFLYAEHAKSGLSEYEFIGVTVPDDNSFIKDNELNENVGDGMLFWDNVIVITGMTNPDLIADSATDFEPINSESGDHGFTIYQHPKHDFAFAVSDDSAVFYAPMIDTSHGPITAIKHVSNAYTGDTGSSGIGNENGATNRMIQTNDDFNWAVSNGGNGSMVVGGTATPDDADSLNENQETATAQAFVASLTVPPSEDSPIEATVAATYDEADATTQDELEQDFGISADDRTIDLMDTSGVVSASWSQ